MHKLCKYSPPPTPPPPPPKKWHNGKTYIKTISQSTLLLQLYQFTNTVLNKLNDYHIKNNDQWHIKFSIIHFNIPAHSGVPYKPIFVSSFPWVENELMNTVVLSFSLSLTFRRYNSWDSQYWSVFSVHKVVWGCFFGREGGRGMVCFCFCFVFIRHLLCFYQAVTINLLEWSLKQFYVWFRFPFRHLWTGKIIKI